jgi:hypothetical protein
MLTVFDYAWERFTARVAGIDDAELVWEPVAGCWTVRPDGAGGWKADGVARGEPEPMPPPITTVAWRVAHVCVSCLGGFSRRLFGSDVPGVVIVGAAADLPALFDAAYGGWRTGLAGLDDAWDRALGSSWGPYADDSVLDLALHVLDEVVHHGGEIGLMRDLYAHRADWIG